ncbi:MAG TPA: ATPase domain-containing protein [Thermoanaerobaculia bacterium]|jgi:circadian clock protein KaiC|nr:ATPase domain-containing protein [Thermoanaerobaculia bacterium]
MQRLSTGNAALDRILGGGLPKNSVNIVMGLPGTGKTILAQQLAFANGTAERPVVYLTTLSEPLTKVVTYLQELRFADVDRVGREVHYDTLAEPLRDRPESLAERMAQLIEQRRPSVVVIDSFKAIMELAPDPAQWRATVFDVASVLAAYDVTALWVGEYAHELTGRSPEFAVADGIIELRRVQSGSRDDRFLQVVKLRGSSFLDGEHAFTLSSGGLTVYPRLVGAASGRTYDPQPERLQTGIGGLDAMIETGWLRGTSTLLAGPSGSGKTLMGLHFLRQGVEDGEPGLLVNFQESPSQLRRIMKSLDWDTDALLRPDRLDLLHSSPVELQIDTIIQELLRRIDAHGVRRIVVDALGDLSKAAADPRRFSDYVYALSQELAQRGVTSMLTVETAGATPLGFVVSGKDVSEMSDNTLLLGMELGPDLVRTVRIIKTRGSAHDGARHVLRISRPGIVVE